MSPAAPAPVAVRLALHLREHGPHTVTELAQAIEVSRTSVETALGTLEGSGIVADAPAPAAKGAGRPARRYAFQSSAGVVVGVDVGAHSIRVLFADLAGVVIAHRSADGLRPDADGATQLDQVVAVVTEAAVDAGIPLTRFRAVGVSLPGIVDDNGRVLASVVIPTWAGIDIVAHLRSAFACPIVVDNGVRLAAVAEHHLGAARLINEVLYLSVGNRIAAGLILEGRPRRGVHNVAGDIGRLAFRGLNARTGQIDWRAADNAEAVFRRAEQGDAEARRELDAFVDELAHGIATLVMTVDPAIVVIGGGLSLARERLLVPLREAVATHIGLPIDVPIVGARLGAEAAAHGALAFAFARCTSDIYGIPQMSSPPLTPLPQATPVAADA
ncbi:ROK family protein [Microbacterium sp. NPDC055903]